MPALDAPTGRVDPAAAPPPSAAGSPNPVWPATEQPPTEFDTATAATFYPEVAELVEWRWRWEHDGGRVLFGWRSTANGTWSLTVAGTWDARAVHVVPSHEDGSPELHSSSPGILCHLVAALLGSCAR